MKCHTCSFCNFIDNFHNCIDNIMGLIDEINTYIDELTHIIPPSDRTAIIRDRTATVQRSENVQGRRQTWTQREKKSQKITNLNKAAFYCVLTAFLLRPVRSYHVLTARPPRPLRAYGVSCEIYGLGNGDHGRSRGALTTII